MGEWDLLGGDPAPGDPGRVRGLGDEFLATHRDAEAAARELRRIVNNWEGAVWRGPAAEQFKKMFASHLPDDLDQLHRSYDQAGRALVGYAGELQRAQDEARQAKANAASADDSRRNGRGQYDNANQSIREGERSRDALDREIRSLYHRLAHMPADDPHRQATESSYYSRQRSRQRTIDSINANVNTRERARRQVDDAEANLTGARKLAEQARALREDAARRAAREVDEASQQGIQNKNFFEQVADFAVGVVTFDPDTWQQLQTALEVISTALVVVALFIPGVNIIAILILVVAVAIFVCVIVQVANGRKDSSAIFWAGLDVAFAATGIKGGSAAKGVAAMMGGEVSKRAGKAAAKRAAEEVAKNSLKNVLRHPGPSGRNIRNYLIRNSKTMGVLKRACYWKDARKAKNLLHFAIAPKRGWGTVHATLKIIKDGHRDYEIYRDYSREWRLHGGKGVRDHFYHHITDPKTLVKISIDLVGHKPRAAMKDAL